MPWAEGSVRQDLCLAAVLGGPLIALLFTVMRCFDRRKAGLGWDDYLICFATTLLIAIIYPSWKIIKMLHYGIHLWEVEPLVLVRIDYNQYHHLTLAFSFLSGLIMPMVKISILLLLLKIGGVFDTLRKAIWVFIVLSIINCVIVQMLLLFQCPQKPDDTAADKTFGGLNCIDRKMLGRINIYQAIFNMSTDLFVFPIPVYIAYKMRMASLKDRLMVVFLFSLGLLVTVIGAIRVYLVYEERVFIKAAPDWTWGGSVWVLQHLEWTVAIVIACVPNFRTLVGRWLRGQSNRSSQMQVGSLDASGSLSPASIRFSKNSKTPMLKNAPMDSIMELEHVDYPAGTGSADIDLEQALRMEFKEIHHLKREMRFEKDMDL
ncbi:hypothetical protein H072_10212 [Dactylellina haptotyla CBS 200.50]|uniref:Rhodopsin domain-containing protein n=1 Tax=Dactylellina haptotyla (strain CBS 200.50) TaxID=1284197 RepID=S7ZZW2_DACHA|nr:hypothetical protein H072_10212 [Dactylellina haptotyla CBS 200.50]